MDPGNAAWVLASAALVLFMTPGLALFYGGMDQSRNVLNMLMMNFYCLLIVPIIWVVVGFSLSYSGSGSVIGNLDWAFLNDLDITGDTSTTNGSTLLAVAYLGMFACITPALISGAVAGRMKFSAWAIFVPLWLVLVYCPIGFWVYGGVWGDDPVLTGWLGERGSLDFAGGTVIHVNAGIAALAAVLVLGKRKGWPRDVQPPHSMPLVMIGTGILWFGWFGFNAGSAFAANGVAIQAFMNTFLAAAAAGLTWAVVERLRDGHFTNLGAASGIVAGLVAITPAAGFVSGVVADRHRRRRRADLLLRGEAQVQGRLRRRPRRRRRPLRRRARRIAADRLLRRSRSSSAARSTRACSTAAGSASSASSSSPTWWPSSGRSPSRSAS